MVLVVSLFDYHRFAAVSTDSCGVARANLNRASDYANAYKYRDAYKATLLGLAANKKCLDVPATLINGGFLLSTKAIAEYAFQQRGDSAADLKHAIDLLDRCQRIVPKLRGKASDLCAKQERRDIDTQRQLTKKQITVY